jgi:flagellar hook-basal body complex protein FliE
MNVTSLLASAAQAGQMRPIEMPRAPVAQPGGEITSFRQMLTDQIKDQSTQIGQQASASLHPVYQTAASQSSGFVVDMVNDVQKLQTRATTSAQSAIQGNGSLHQAMIAMEEASVSFQMLVEMRNKVVESLQELMRMQI